MYQNVIFDLDGTLLNTLEDLADAGNWVCREKGWPTHEVEAFKYFVGNGLTKMIERISPEEFRAPEQVAQTLAEFTPYYNAHKADKTAPYAGMAEALKKLRAAGVQMAVLTNKADELAGAVMEHYYPGLFPVVQGALPGFPTKPDPTLLHQLMERMGADSGSTLFVGDSNVDIRTAKNGGLAGCGVLWGFRTREELLAEGADYLAETPAQLAELILR